MKKHQKFRTLLIPLNYFKNQLKKTMIWVKPFPPIFRELSKSRLNSRIFKPLVKNAGILSRRFWQMVVGWDLGGLLLLLLSKIYRFAIQPVIKILMKHLLILWQKIEQRFIVFQDDFYLEMEDLINHDEPGDYTAKLQYIGGVQVTYQYEIPWVERTFAAMQMIQYFLLAIHGRLMANAEKSWIMLDKFNNRRRPFLMMVTPEFEITNPEIFEVKLPAILKQTISKSKISSADIYKRLRTINLRKPIQIILHPAFRFIQTKSPFIKSQFSSFGIITKLRSINLNKKLKDFIIQSVKFKIHRNGTKAGRVKKKPGFT